MNQWKDELKQAFEAPMPLGKKKFIQQLDKPCMHFYEFLMVQIRYIRKWVWFISVFAFLASILGAAILPADALWIVSAFTPLLALAIISETGRSERYEMAELEMSTRFSLKSVTLARLGILGITNAILLGLMIPVGLWNNVLSPIAAGLYIVTPFLLTTFLGLHIVRSFREHKTMDAACIGAAIAVSFSVFFFHSTIPSIYQETYLVWWGAGALWLCTETGKLSIEMIKGMEELTWNFL